MTDLIFAKNAGIGSCLLLSGMTKSIDIIPKENLPDFLLKAFVPS
jgi:ribonucleotide monophosphatase NagD (HAD superfamily)